MRLRTRIDRLAQHFPALEPWSPEGRADRRWQKVVTRFLNQLERALALMNESEQRKIQDALESRSAGRHGALHRWLDDLAAGRCRMPVMSPETMKAVILSWFHLEVGQPMVCNQCGLEYPRLKRRPAWMQPDGKASCPIPRVFDACPNCGASRYDTSWPSRTPHLDLPWKKLDAWIGKAAGQS
jgi:hypothetical protein